MNTKTPMELYVEANYPQFALYMEEMRDVFRFYTKRKNAANAMDFDDLLLNWKVLLEQHEEASAALRARFRHILVDEYQDTNKLQAERVDARPVGESDALETTLSPSIVSRAYSRTLLSHSASRSRRFTSGEELPSVSKSWLLNASIAQNRYQFRRS